MRERLVRRYYCDFCKKAGLSKYHMMKHEKHCTMNPVRECRMCVFLHGSRCEPMADLLSILPAYPEFPDFMFSSDLDEEFKAAIKPAFVALREKVENCPVCIMAALRQKGIPVPLIDDFNFTEECKSIFNKAAEDGDYEGSYY